MAPVPVGLLYQSAPQQDVGLGGILSLSPPAVGPRVDMGQIRGCLVGMSQPGSSSRSPPSSPVVIPPPHTHTHCGGHAWWRVATATVVTWVKVAERQPGFGEPLITPLTVINGQIKWCL